jgi:hypothetical protein
MVPRRGLCRAGKVVRNQATAGVVACMMDALILLLELLTELRVVVEQLTDGMSRPWPSLVSW